MAKINVVVEQHPVDVRIWPDNGSKTTVCYWLSGCPRIGEKEIACGVCPCAQEDKRHESPENKVTHKEAVKYWKKAKVADDVVAEYMGGQSE